MAQSAKHDETLSKLIELKWRQAEQKLAALDAEIRRVQFQLDQLNATLSDKSEAHNLNVLASSACGNRFVEKQVQDIGRLETRLSDLQKHLAMAKHNLRRALHAKQHFE